MMRRSILSAILAVALAVPAAVGVARLLPGSATPDSELSSDEEEEVFTGAPLTLLAQVHEQMLGEGLRLVRATATFEAVTGTLLLVDVDVVWAPETVESGAAGLKAITAILQVSPQSRDALAQLASPFPSLAVVGTDGTVVALGVLDSPTEFAQLPPDGPLFLGDAAAHLFGLDHSPIPLADACDTGPTWAPASPVDALLEYFAALGDRSQLNRAARGDVLDKAVEELILANGELVDPVTGRIVAPAANDLMYQLLDGVTEVAIRPAIPVGVRLASTGPLGEVDQAAVFVDEVSGRTLGWIGSAAASLPDTGGDTVLELAHPTTGGAVLLYVRSFDDARLTCPPGAVEVAYMRILHDDITGTGRAHVDLAGRTVAPLVLDE